MSRGSSEWAALARNDTGLGPTRIRDLVIVAAVAGVGAYLLTRFNYSSIPRLPRFAGVSAGPAQPHPVAPCRPGRVVPSAQAAGVAGAAPGGRPRAQRREGLGVGRGGAHRPVARVRVVRLARSGTRGRRGGRCGHGDRRLGRCGGAARRGAVARILLPCTTCRSAGGPMTVAAPRAVRAAGNGGSSPCRSFVATLPRRPRRCAVGVRRPGSLPVWMSPDLRDHGVRPR